MQIGSSDVDSWEGDSELVNQHEAVAQQLTKCKAQTLLARTSACRTGQISPKIGLLDKSMQQASVRGA